MSAARISAKAAQRLAHVLFLRVGLRPAPEATHRLQMALETRLDALGEADADAYLERLEREGGEELRGFLPLVTVGKTEFFRDPTQFRALREVVVPELARRAAQQMRRICIWSAGCASGEEAYSLAMLLDELRIERWAAEILATDVNPKAVELAALGRFQKRHLRSLPHLALDEYFVHRGDAWEAGERLKERIRFAVQNLADVSPFPLPCDGGAWDLILCRNVLIYFDREGMANVVRRLHEAMAEGGYLCLGYSESLFRVDVALELREIGGAFLYRRSTPEQGELPVPAAGKEPARAALPRPPPPMRGGNDGASSVAVRMAQSEAPRAGSRTMAEQAAAAREPLTAASALIEQGRFDEAVDGLDRALQAEPENVALLLMHGNTMLILRRLEASLADFRRALELEPLCAEARLFLAIACAEGGEPMLEEALREIGRALFLDPHLALAHYFAGRFAERRGNLADARRSYRNAMDACREHTPALPLSIMPGFPADSALLDRASRYALAALDERT